LRVRKVGRQWIQTLKGGGQVDGGLHRRHEWESRVAGPVPDLAALVPLVDDVAWQRRLGHKGLAEKLQPVFTTRFRRTTWQLTDRDGNTIELALDQGDIQAGRRRLPICEIELELKGGSPRSLFELARELQSVLPFRLGDISKAARGYAARHPPPATSTAAVKATPLALTAARPISEALAAIAGNCIAQIQANEPGVCAGRDRECLHQMRVGLRRLRVGLALFRDLEPCPPPILAELDWLGAALGTARDWDVLVGDTLPAIAEALPGDTAGAGLLMAAERLARAPRRDAAVAVRSPRYTRLLLDLGEWLQDATAQMAEVRPDLGKLAVGLPEFAAEALGVRRATLKKRLASLDRGDIASWHRARIAAKKVRYALEFCRALLPPSRTTRELATLNQLQDTLGRINDLLVATTLLEDIGRRDPGQIERVLFARGFLSAQAVQLKDRLLRPRHP
jgi:inorganic triphosphatase YgiF